MRRTVNIFALILVYFLACGKSCDNEEQYDSRYEQRRVIAETDSLRSVFGTDSLSVTTLQAYMETAKQNVYDLNDYLKIANDTSAAIPFRSKAREIIRSYFLPGEEPVKLSKPFSLDSVYELEAFQRINDSVFGGRLTCSFKNVKVADQGLDSSSGNMIIEIYLVKSNKNFGKGKLRVWNVYLGKTE